MRIRIRTSTKTLMPIMRAVTLGRAAVHDMRAYHGPFYVAMPQKPLDRSDGSTIQQMHHE